MPETASPLIISTAVALGIGLLIGTERERAKDGPSPATAGVRTFALVALLGLFGSVLGNVALAVFAIFVGAITIAGYLHTRESDPGITTEVALLACFGLGALSASQPAYAGAAAVVITVLLTSRGWLHDLVTQRMSDRELHDGLLLAAAALVVLPLLPDRTIDPWQTLNPRRMWWVVVLVMAINALGYVGLRVWGSKAGLLVAGVFGGLVSSVSTHGAMGQRAKENATITTNAAAAATLSSVTTAVSLFTVIVAVNVPLAMSLLPACAAAALVSATYSWILVRRTSPAESGELSLGRPVSLRAALVFAAIVSGVLIISDRLTAVLGSSAALASVTAVGFADAHSGAISAALLERNGAVTTMLGQIAVLLSFTANALTKVVASTLAGTRAFAWRIAVGIVASVAAAWVTWALVPSIGAPS